MVEFPGGTDLKTEGRGQDNLMNQTTHRSKEAILTSSQCLLTGVLC